MPAPNALDAPHARRAHIAAIAVGAAAALAMMLLALLTEAAAAPAYPELTGQIVDNAKLLKPEDHAAILAELRSLEGASTDQVAVVTVPSLDGYAIEDYGIGLARKWQVGQKDKDNGILLIVAPNERKVRIEVGRRLEPVMTDTMSKIIIENAMLPMFRRGDYSGGIRAGVRDIKAVLLGDAEAVKERAKTRTPQDDVTPLVHLVLFVLIVAFVFYQMRKQMERQRQWEANLTPEQRRQLRRQRRRSAGPIIVIPGGSSDWGGGWSGGDGGGWSGGGGGFGGGGASGSW